MRVLLVCLIVILAGCGSTPPIPDDHYYRLRPAASFASGAPVLEEKLAVETPRAAGVRRGRSMLYSEDPEHLRYKQYSYHHWDEAPGTMLHRRMLEAIRESNVASTVTAKSRLDAGYRLSSHLHRFDRLVRPNEVKVMVEVEFELYNINRPLEPVHEGVYSETVVAATPSMEDTVIAFSEATDAVLARLIEDLRTL